MNYEPREMSDTFVVGVILGEPDEGGLKFRFEQNTTIAMSAEQYASMNDTLAEMFRIIAERTRNEDAAPNN